jgi:L-alanine-DL-glutamate epimerase-like enolase superfamily enzyme
MKINKVNIYKVSLPFTGDFSISRKKGPSANNIVVEVVADKGEIKGYGEGAPIRFVTGETQESAAKSASRFAQKDSFPWKLDNVSQIWDFIDSLPKGKEDNAAICAIETALLDALGKSQNKAITDYFFKDFSTSTVYYGAAIPLGNKSRIMELCELIKKLKINQLRIKMDKNFEQNREAVETVKLLFGDDYDLRIDPNGVWDRDLAFKHIPLIKKHKVKIVEEPIRYLDPGFEEFVELLKSYGVILMACETVCTLEDLEKIIKDGYYSMTNIKLCRSGGFRRSLRMIKLIRSSGLSFQIGCTLGESGILSAAGRALGLLCRDAKYYDGSYDRFMLKENITTEHVSFGMGGEAGPLDGPGLGVVINKESLMRLSNGSASITISNPLS